MSMNEFLHALGGDFSFKRVEAVEWQCLVHGCWAQGLNLTVGGASDAYTAHREWAHAPKTALQEQWESYPLDTGQRIY